MQNKEEFLKLMAELGVDPYVQNEQDYINKVIPLNKNQSEGQLRPEDEQRMLKLRALELLKSKMGE